MTCVPTVFDTAFGTKCHPPDSVSRCQRGEDVNTEAASENTVAVLRQAINRFGIPATVLSDNGSCFASRGGSKKSTRVWTLAIFANELPSLDMGLPNSGLCHQQTNEKPERLCRIVEDEKMCSRGRYNPNTCQI